jgi:hypothetical protein
MSAATNMDFSAKEVAAVRGALHFLHRRCGTWATLGRALGFNGGTLRNVANGHRNATATIVLRVPSSPGSGSTIFSPGSFRRRGRVPIAAMDRPPCLTTEPQRPILDDDVSLPCAVLDPRPAVPCDGVRCGERQRGFRPSLPRHRCPLPRHRSPGHATSAGFDRVQRAGMDGADSGRPEEDAGCHR